MGLVRLQKILASAGVCARRAAENYIKEGRVKVNGQVIATLGSKADPSCDRIEVQGVGVLAPEPYVYMAMHKPIHVVTTLKDPEGRPTVASILSQSRAHGARRYEGGLPRVFPVGRLDFDAEGLVLLTNDGELAQKLLHPRFHVPKTYAVKVRGKPDIRALNRLRHGVRLKSPSGRLSRPTKPSTVTILKNSPANTWLEITIVEGRHHQVKLMCQAIGHPVSRLIRVDFGGIALGDLPMGAWRFLSSAEVLSLKAWSKTSDISGLLTPAQPHAKAKAHERKVAQTQRRGRQALSKGQARQGPHAVSRDPGRRRQRPNRPTKVR